MSRGPAEKRPSGSRGLAPRVALLCLLLCACTTGSNLEICHARCDAALRCLSISHEAGINCHRSCDERSGTYSDQDRRENSECANAAELRREKLMCYGGPCSEAAACELKIVISRLGPRCIKV